MGTTSLSYVKCYYAGSEFSLSVNGWVGQVSGYSAGVFGSVYSFSPTVHARSVTFALSFKVFSNSKSIYYRVVTDSGYSGIPSGTPSFTSPSGSSSGSNGTQSITVTGDFAAGETYYLFLQSTTGDYGYIADISGSISYVRAAPAVYVKTAASAWSECEAMYVKTEASTWSEAKELFAKTGSSVWSEAE